ncbi:hypothetical protein JCM10213v2_004430 [Rhodosporidiobolus nylandii]
MNIDTPSTVNTSERPADASLPSLSADAVPRPPTSTSTRNGENAPMDGAQAAQGNEGGSQPPYSAGASMDFDVHAVGVDGRDGTSDEDGQKTPSGEQQKAFPPSVPLSALANRSHIVPAQNINPSTWAVAQGAKLTKELGGLKEKTAELEKQLAALDLGVSPQSWASPESDAGDTSASPAAFGGGQRESSSSSDPSPGSWWEDTEQHHRAHGARSKTPGPRLAEEIRSGWGVLPSEKKNVEDKREDEPVPEGAPSSDSQPSSSSPTGGWGVPWTPASNRDVPPAVDGEVLAYFEDLEGELTTKTAQVSMLETRLQTLEQKYDEALLAKALVENELEEEKGRLERKVQRTDGRWASRFEEKCQEVEALQYKLAGGTFGEHSGVEGYPHDTGCLSSFVELGGAASASMSDFPGETTSASLDASAAEKMEVRFWETSEEGEAVEGEQ